MRFSRFILTAFLVFLPKFLLAEFLDDLGPASKLNFGSVANSVNWSPDGTDLAIGGRAGSVGKVAIYGWDTSISSTVDLGHDAKLDFGSEARSVNWSPDGKYLAIGGQAGSVGKVAIYGWDTSISSTIDLGAGAKLDFGSEALSVNWSPDGKYLAIGGQAGFVVGKVAIYGWDKSTNSLVDLGAGAKLDFGDRARSVNWSPDGKYLAIGGFFNGPTGKVAVYKWDNSTNSLVDLGAGAKLDFGVDAFSVNWSPDGKYLAIGGQNGTTDVAVYQWNNLTNSFVDLGAGAKLDFGDAALSVNWSPDGKYLAIGGSNGTKDVAVYQWNSLTNSFVDLGAGAKLDFSDFASSVNWSPDQQYLAILGGVLLSTGKVAVYLTYDEYLMSLISQNTYDINFIESRKIIYKNRLP